MIIAYGNNDDSLTRKKVTKDELTDIIQSNEIVNLLRVENHEIDENGFFDVPGGITNIEEYAFRGCSSLTTISLPDSLTNIGAWAFTNCSSLTTVNLPNSITNIEEYAFRGCSSLTTITLPKGLTYIGESAFRGCSSLTTIILPKGLTYIGVTAFFGCSSLTTISRPESLTNIGYGAFYGSYPLTSINLPESLTNIGLGAFFGCSALTNISLPDGLTNIGPNSFNDCFSLTTITLPKGITNIGGDAFARCSNLETIIIDGDENEVERVKALMPEEHRDKVVSKSLFKQALIAQKEAIIKLATTPQFSSLYKWQAYLKPLVPDSILGIINSYLIDDEIVHPIFETGRERLQNVALRLFFTNPSEYIRELSEIKDHYKNIAEETIKPSIKWQFYDAKKETSRQEEKIEATVTQRPYN